ncbi:MAG: hypothetical protein LBV06_05635 [Propionibacteriaceae bacterium]|jgi:hypothetical protein|nr:hypothetical protein [Propionibacteriaceae bacterium]
MFDDSALDDPRVLASRGAFVEWLALSGARLRRESDTTIRWAADRILAVNTAVSSIMVVGRDAGVVRAVVEPTAKAKVIDWSGPDLPTWAGPLDVLVVLGPSSHWGDLCAQARRRGLVVIVLTWRADDDHVIADAVIRLGDADRLVGLVAAWELLGLAQVSSPTSREVLAARADAVACGCGPAHHLGANPAKNLACAMADAAVLIWSDTVVAARAAQRMAEGLREVSRPWALAVDDTQALAILRGCPRRDPFADPVDDQTLGSKVVLVMMREFSASGGSHDSSQVARVALSRGVRVETITTDESDPVSRYVDLCQQGLFAVAYVGMASMEER